MKNLAKILQVGLPFFWAGAVVAISFMEAPLKFGAPNLTREVALEVGHIVFDALNKLEIAVAIVFALTLVFSRDRRVVLTFGLAALILLIQTVVLFPILDERTLAMARGETVPESSLHLIYIALEVVKLISLLVLGSFAVTSRGEERE